MSEMIDTSWMKGEDLFRYYTLSDAADRDYGQTLQAAHVEIGDTLFPMLEQCEREGRRIRLKYDDPLWEAGVLDCPFKVVME
jgi:hypothetical protein